MQTHDEIIRENIVRGFYPTFDRNKCQIWNEGYRPLCGESWCCICGYFMGDGHTIGCYCCGRLTEDIKFNPFRNVSVIERLIVHGVATKEERELIEKIGKV